MGYSLDVTGIISEQPPPMSRIKPLPHDMAAAPLVDAGKEMGLDFSNERMVNWKPNFVLQWWNVWYWFGFLIPMRYSTANLRVKDLMDPSWPSSWFRRRCKSCAWLYNASNKGLADDYADETLFITQQD